MKMSSIKPKWIFLDRNIRESSERDIINAMMIIQTQQFNLYKNYFHFSNSQ